MTTYSNITIAGSTVSDFLRYSVNRSISDNNSVSSFEGELNNEYGRNKNKFNLGDEIIVKADLTDPPSTKIFTGILEDIQYKGEGVNDVLNLAGRDYSARLQDRTVEPEVYNNLQAGSIVKDLINKYTNNLTTTNVTLIGSNISRITFNQIPVYDAVKKLADLTNMTFYVDNDKDLHFEVNAGSSSGSTFNNTNVLSADFSSRRDSIANQVWVYGDRYLDGYKETFTAGSPLNGSLFTLLYKPHNTEITVSGGTIQPGEIKGININIGSNTKYLVSYEDKQIIFTSGTSQGANIPASGNSVVVNYKRSLPIIKVGTDDSSVVQYGQRNKVIIDKSIKDPATAEAIMKNEIEKLSDPLKEGNIQLKGIIDVTPGQTYTIDLPNEGVSSQIYNLIEAKYEFNKENLLTDNVLNIKVNKKLVDLTDTLKDILLNIKKMQSQDMTDSDFLTVYKFSVGSMGLRHSGAVVYTRGLGSSFILARAGPGTNPQAGGRLGSIIGSGINFLGDSRSGLSIAWSGAYF